METKRICPSCQKPLAADGPMGLCPECLVKAGFPSGVETESGSAARSAFVPPSVADIAKLFPQLEVLELIGKGGMGAVYKARQIKLNRIVALKILPPGIGQEPAFAARFTREAQALAQLNHPGIVTLYEFGEASGQFYFLMEFVDGVNLRQLLAGSRVSAREALAIVPQICDALQFAHDQGIVHRDIKPENILLDRRGRVKVADFGLAKIIANDAPLTPSLSPSDGERVEQPGEGTTIHTDASKVMGTPQYMSPEQIQAPGEVDHRADIYALGVVFYQMLTGELPGKKLEPPSKKVSIDVRLDEIVLRALDNNPALRYQHVSEVKTMVETIAATPPGSSGREETQTENPEIGNRQSAIPSRFSRTAIVGALFLLLLPVGLVFNSLATLHNASLASNDPWRRILGLPGILLIVIGQVAPTILGWISVAQIRRSAGKLYGLGLAVFDGLLFPLLALDVVIGWLWPIVIKMLMGHSFDTREYLRIYNPDIAPSLVREYATLATVITVPIVDFLIIRAVWRTVNAGRRRGDESQTEKPEGQSLRMSAPISGESRFSRTAIVGACWALLFFVTLAAAYWALKPVPTPAGTHESTSINILTVGLPGFLALFGTTILGWVAVSQIRRSAGKLHGLWLAVFDGLLFPLLALDVAIWLAFVKIWRNNPPQYGTWLGKFLVEHDYLPLLLLPVLCAVVDFLIIRAVWRAVNQGIAPQVPSIGNDGGANFQSLEKSKPARFWRIAAASVLLVLAVVGVVLIARSVGDFGGVPDFERMTKAEMESNARRSAFPLAATITRNAGTVLVVHDNVDVHYVFFAPKAVGTSDSSSHNTHSLAWLDNGAFKLTEQWTFGYLRESIDPHHLKVNGKEYDLRQGRVFLPHDDGTLEQRPLEVSLATAMDPDALATVIANHNWASSAGLSFGPVIERVVPNGGKCLNLLTGQLLPLHGLMTLAPDVRRAQGDVYWPSGENDTRVLWILDCRVLDLDPAAWSNLSAAELGEKFQQQADSQRSSPGQNETRLPPGIYGFRGYRKTGLIKVIADTNNYGGVKLRYKLVQDGATNAAVSQQTQQGRIEQQLLRAMEHNLSATADGATPGRGEFIDYEFLGVDVAKDLRTATINLAGVKPRWSSPHKELWKRVPKGEFVASDEGNGLWIVTGKGDLGALQFKVQVTNLVEAADTVASPDAGLSAPVPVPVVVRSFPAFVPVGGILLLSVGGIAVIVLAVRKSKLGAGRTMAIGCGVLMLGFVLVLLLVAILAMVRAIQVPAARRAVEDARLQSALATPSVAFGPVVERTVLLDDSGKAFLNLATGDFVAAPDWVRLDSDPEHQNNGLAGWLETTKEVDVMATLTPNGRHLLVTLCHAGLRNNLRPEAWDEPDLLDAECRAFLQSATDQAYRVSFWAEEGQTTLHAFRTRTGAAGLLQAVYANYNDPRGVKLRYKLVQLAASKNSDAK